MTPLHQQLLNTLRELEILRESTAYANELSVRLDNEERELAMLEEMIPQEQLDVDKLEKNGITSLVRKMIGDREEKIDKEREEYEKVSNRHIELFKSIELIRFELGILNNKNASLEGVEAKAVQLLKQRERELIEADPKIAAWIKEKKNQKAIIFHQQNRISNAIETGEKAQVAVTNIEQILNNAITNLNSVSPDRRPLIDESIRNQRRQYSKVNGALGRFQNEAKAILTELELDLELPTMAFGHSSEFPIFEAIDDFLLVQSIHISLDGLTKTKENIEEALRILEHEYDETTEKLAGLEEERKGIILSAR